MELLRKLRLFYNYSWSFKKLLWEATWFSVWTEINLKRNQMKVFKPFDKNLQETEITNKLQKKSIIHINQIMTLLEKWGPWKPMCYNRALTAKYLLKKRGIETTLHIGFKPRKEEESFEGHAWLTIQNYFITGKIPQLHLYKKFKPIKSLIE